MSGSRQQRYAWGQRGCARNARCLHAPLYDFVILCRLCGLALPLLLRLKRHEHLQQNSAGKGVNLYGAPSPLPWLEWWCGEKIEVPGVGEGKREEVGEGERDSYFHIRWLLQTREQESPGLTLGAIPTLYWINWTEYV